MKHVIVGTAGHIDHGKSALVRALTGTDPDRLKEEKARGITIDLGFAHDRHDDITLAFVDVPGHERFIRNMLAGASGIDCVVLVIAADESVMPQTREHFDICRLLDVRAGVIALTKCDLADPETTDLVTLETRELGRRVVPRRGGDHSRLRRDGGGTRDAARRAPRPGHDTRGAVHRGAGAAAGRPGVHREGVWDRRDWHAGVGTDPGGARARDAPGRAPGQGPGFAGAW